MIVKCTSTNTGKYFHEIIVNCQSRNITSARPMYLHIETTSICNAIYRYFIILGFLDGKEGLVFPLPSMFLVSFFGRCKDL
jgi:hypothetical protein